MRVRSLLAVFLFAGPFLITPTIAGPQSPGPGGAQTPQTQPSVQGSSNTYAVLGNMNGADIEALAFVVLMESSKSAQDDLKAIMTGVKAINNAKSQLRRTLSDAQRLPPNPCTSAMALRDCIRRTEQRLMKMDIAALDIMRASVINAQSDLATLADSLRHAPEEFDRQRKHLPPPARPLPPSPCKGWNASFWKQCIALSQAELDGNLPDQAAQAMANAQLDQIKQDMDSLSELGETSSLRLQMAMDRISKMMSTLSNILKKISDTSSAISQNLK